MVLAMNQMVDKLKTLFAEEAARSEKLREEAYQDSLTGLANRRQFDIRLSNQLVTNEQHPEGYLLLLRSTTWAASTSASAASVPMR